MSLLFFILIILACVVLSLIVLVQNPKGGGLAGSLSGISNQFMGVKQTTDVLEKGTWLFAAIIGVLCLLSTIFISGGTTSVDRIDNVTNGPLPGSAPAQQPQSNPNNGTFPGAQPTPNTP